MVFKKIIFQNRYVALETPSRPPPPFMANTILNFHFDYLITSLSWAAKKKWTLIFVLIISKPKVIFGAAGKGAMWDGFCFRRGHTYSTALASKQVEVLEGQQCLSVFVLYIYSIIIRSPNPNNSSDTDTRCLV